MHACMHLFKTHNSVQAKVQKSFQLCFFPTLTPPPCLLLVIKARCVLSRAAA
jgi:hypothetical protein